MRNIGVALLLRGATLILMFLAFEAYFSQAAHSEEIFLSYGLGVFHSAENNMAEVKMVNLGFRFPVWKGLHWEYKIGFWTDDSGNPARSCSGYTSTGPVVEVDLKPWVIRSSYGLALITSPDSYLGGSYPQFNGSLYLGLRDSGGVGIGAQYEHISSAGILTPNLGRDFVVLQLSQVL